MFKFLGSIYFMKFLGLSLIGLIVSCEFFDNKTDCAQEELVNLCIAGEPVKDTSTTFIREGENGFRDNPVKVFYSADSVGTCFTELTQNVRILVIQNEIVIDSTDWFQQEPTADGCHLVSKTIVFD